MGHFISETFFLVSLFVLYRNTISDIDNNNNRFTALCLELPGWAGTRRIIHPPTILTLSDTKVRVTSEVVKWEAEHSIEWASKQIRKSETCQQQQKATRREHLPNVNPCTVWCFPNYSV